MCCLLEKLKINEKTGTVEENKTCIHLAKSEVLIAKSEVLNKTTSEYMFFS